MQVYGDSDQVLLSGQTTMPGSWPVWPIETFQYSCYIESLVVQLSYVFFGQAVNSKPQLIGLIIKLDRDIEMKGWRGKRMRYLERSIRVREITICIILMILMA